MAPFDLWTDSVENYYGTSTWVLSPNVATATSQFTGGQFAPIYRLITKPLWNNLRERDRWHLARVRSGAAVSAVLVCTPRRCPAPRPARYTLRISPTLPRWERNPLNKRALSRR
jgi:hypothetical protein